MIELSVLKDAIFEASAEAMVISNSKGIMIEANKRCLDLFGYEKEELIGQKVEILIPPHLKKAHEKYRDKFHSKPQNRPMGTGMALFGVTKEGKNLPIAVSLGHAKIEGENFVIAFIIDITEQEEAKNKLKNLNNELEQRVTERTKELAELVNKLGAANHDLRKAQDEIQEALSKERELSEMKSRFVSMASHEFRTPLSTILSSSTLIEKYPKEEQSDKRFKHTKRIQSNVKHLTALLNDFLSLEKLSEGKIECKLEETNIKDFIQEIIDEVLSIKGATQSISTFFEGQVLFKTDRNILKNIILNLLSNAIKYSGEDGRIKININVEDNFSIVVVDNGIGIPEEDQQHLFERFFRAKNVTNIQGTGLGLSIVKKYIELLRGEIKVESQYTEGTSVFVALPKIEKL